MSRVQGGWASSPKKVAKKPVDKISQNQEYNVVYQENTEKILIKPDDIIIKLAGEHIISKEPSGISKITFYPDFLDASESDRIFSVLLQQLQWEQRKDKYGPQPRLTVWYGEHPYSYSGLKHEASEEWHPLLLELRYKLETLTSHSFNSVLCNLYRDNHDSVDWHCDDEAQLRKNPYIASISLGDVRSFELRKKPPPDRMGDFSYSQHIKMHLPHGSLLIMEGSTQEDWQHRVSKEYHDRGPRINLTFRTIFADKFLN